MSRRVQSVGMIVLLLAGQPLHAAGQGQVVRLRVKILHASDTQAEALRAAVRQTGAEAYVVSRGRVRWLEIVGGRGRLATALEAVRAAARAQGADIELPRRGEGRELLAVPSRSGVWLPRPQPAGQAKATLADTPELKSLMSGGRAADRAGPPARMNIRLPAWAIRGPPA